MLRRKRLADLPEHWDFGELTPGAQVRVRRSGYYHHGIYIGNGEIVHFDGSPNEQDAAAVRVRRTGMEEFLRGGLPELRIYGRAERKLLRAPDEIAAAALSPLRRDENGVWRMDYEDMDRRLKEHSIRLAILCSPHNPSGRVWERWELEKAMEVYAANDCFVLSDEIWSDLILPGYHHIPTLSVSDDARRRTAAFYAPSKTFSLAGLIGSYHIIPDPWLRDRVTRQGDLSHYNSCNVLSLHALLGAYSDEGAQWLDELRPVLADNIRYACDFIAAHFPGVQVMQPQGTYMLFLDCAAWLQEHHMTLRELEERGARAGVIWQDGAAFAWPDSIRMNLALPHSRLVEAMERLRVHAFY